MSELVKRKIPFKYTGSYMDANGIELQPDNDQNKIWVMKTSYENEDWGSFNKNQFEDFKLEIQKRLKKL